ncbi:MAG: hypothetical protein IIT66_03865, partial [Acetobacter sp.]|nr:hypothetical protein [Acetobacter sp.]
YSTCLRARLKGVNANTWNTHKHGVMTPCSEYLSQAIDSAPLNRIQPRVMTRGSEVRTNICGSKTKVKPKARDTL